MAAARLLIVAVLCVAVCNALPLHGSKGQEVSVKTRTLSKDEDLNTINFQETDSQKLSLAGMCFLALTGLFFITMALLFCVKEKSAYAEAMNARLADIQAKAAEAKENAANAASGGVDAVPGASAVTGAASAGLEVASGLADKVPGLKSGAGLVTGTVGGAFGAVKDVGSNHIGNTMSLFERLFAPEKQDMAEKTLDLVPTFSILMLFVMFRAREQGILGVDGEVAQTAEGQTYVMTQSFMMLGVFAIYLQAMDFLDITVKSEILGNLSQSLGMLCSFVAWGGMIYGVIYARDPNRPLSVAATCIMSMVTLVFLLQLVLMFLRFKKTAHEKLMGVDASDPEPEPVPDDEDPLEAGSTFSAGFAAEAGQLDITAVQPFNMSKIVNAKNLTSFVPLMSLFFFYAHMRAIEVGKGKMIQELAETEDDWKLVVMSMYGATGGLFLQVLGVLVVWDCNRKLGEITKILGLLSTYVGLGGVAVTLVEILRAKMTDGTTSTTMSIAIALGLLGLVALSKMIMTVATTCFPDQLSPMAKKIFDEILLQEKMMMMVSMMLMWMHYRIMKVDSGEFFCTVDNIAKLEEPGYGMAKVMLLGEACLVLGFGLVFLFSLLEAACKWLAETPFFAGLKFLEMGFIYFGFGVVVYVALTLNVPLAATSMDAAPQC